MLSFHFSEVLEILSIIKIVLFVCLIFRRKRSKQLILLEIIPEERKEIAGFSLISSPPVAAAIFSS